MAALAGGCVMELRAVCRSMEVGGAVAVMAHGGGGRRLRRTCGDRGGRQGAAWWCASAARRGGVEALHGGMEAAAVQGNKSRRQVGRDPFVLWVHTGRVRRIGTAGAPTSVWLTLGGGVGRRCARVHARVRLHPSGVCR
ncbi:hypothetical protein VPH35_019973 [Triticum aestivum]